MTFWPINPKAAWLFSKGHIHLKSRLEDAVCDVEFIFEAIVEDIKVKVELMKRVSQCCKPTAVIATNTIGLSVNSVTEGAIYKERTLGLRFIFPVYNVPEVDITPSKSTSKDTIEKGFLCNTLIPFSRCFFSLCFSATSTGVHGQKADFQH